MGITKIKLRQKSGNESVIASDGSLLEREPSLTETPANFNGANVPLLYVKGNSGNDIVNSVVRVTSGTGRYILCTSPVLQKTFGSNNNTYTIATSAAPAKLIINEDEYCPIGQSSDTVITMGYNLEYEEISTTVADYNLEYSNAGKYVTLVLTDNCNLTINTDNITTLHDNYILIKCKSGYTYDITFDNSTCSIPTNNVVTLDVTAYGGSYVLVEFCITKVLDNIIITYKELGVI